MASSGTFMTFIPSLASVTLTGGNTKAVGGGGNFDNPYCTMSFDAEDTDGFYWEWRVSTSDAATAYGIARAENNEYCNIANPTYGFYASSGNGYGMAGNGNKRDSSTDASYGGTSTSGNPVIGIAVRKGKIYFSIDGTFQNSGDPVNETGEAYSGITGFWTPTFGLNGTHGGILNAGQDSTFLGNETKGGNADANGFGDFHTAPPTGFKALCTANMPIDEEVDPAETDDDFVGGKQFGVVTFTGNGTARTISGLGFQPDFIWAKRRSGTGKRHYLVDSVRGFTSYLHTDQAVSEGTSTDGVTSATSDGFAIGGSLDYINENTSTYVAWCWRAGGTSSTNTSGTITSTVSANQNAGFSIVKWRSNNSANQTIGHGLSKAPRFIISKPYSASTWSWHIFHHYQGSVGRFNFASGSTNAFSAGTGTYGAMPGASVFTVGTAGNLMPNNSTTDCISYCWHDVDGLQRFGTYEGNGNADGPYIHLGFRPRLFVQKRADSTGSWRVWDSERHPFSYPDAILRWGTDGAEDTANGVVEFMAAGVKIRMTYSEMNADGGKFIYMAWGDIPHRYNNAF